MPINEPDQKKRRFFAIASVGKGRWYWVVWPALAEIHASAEPLLHVGDGYEATKARAVERALAVAGRNGEWIAAKYASIYHHRRSRGGDQPAGARQPGLPAAQDFLYREEYDAQRDAWVSVPHRVIKRTKLYVFVEQRVYAPGSLTGGWADREPAAFRLDRQMLEEEGYAFVSVTADIADGEQPVFYRSAHALAGGGAQFKCLEMLGLSWPCTQAEVKAAYRRSVKGAHPDGGGSQERFLALQEAYQQALRLCG